MIMSPVSIAVFLLALTSATGQVPVNSSSDNYDYFLLVRYARPMPRRACLHRCHPHPQAVGHHVLRLWTLCRASCVRDHVFTLSHRINTPIPSNRFSIHGLWPERLDGSWPSCCDSDFPFRMQKIIDLLPELAHDWFSYTSGIKYQCNWDEEQTPWTKRVVSHVHQLLLNTFKSRNRVLLEDDEHDHKGHFDDDGDMRDDHHDHKKHHGKHAAHHHDDDDVDDYHKNHHLANHHHHHEDAVAKHTSSPQNRDSPNFQFWRHEWEKHGTCSLDILENEKEYFETVLRLHRAYSIDVRRVLTTSQPTTYPSQDYLHDADIVPASDRYLYKDVLKAIADGAGAEPFISCRAGEVNEVNEAAHHVVWVQSVTHSA